MPEQRLYESIRPITLYGIPPAERAQATYFAESTLRRTADTFDKLGMAGLFHPTKQQRDDHHCSLPVPMRQLIVDLKAEYPDFSCGNQRLSNGIQLNVCQIMLRAGPTSIPHALCNLPCSTMSGLSASLYPPRVLNSLPEAKRTRSLHATEFLASQVERVSEVTSWSGLVWG
jgi:hypothetical protein